MGKLELKNINKTFGETIAAKNVNLTVEDRDFAVLLGPSGCGKTTLLRITAGLEKPDSGEVYLDGEMILDKEPGERNVAMMFQDIVLYPNMNVYENIAFPLKIKNYKGDIEEKVDEMLKKEKIEDKKYASIDELSGGEAQRVVMARVLIQDPKIYLMDEPFSNLDHQLRVYWRREISRIHRKTKATILFVTHNQEEAMRVGNKLAIMRNGRIQQVGAPKEIFHDPQNFFVASFIGHPRMNFLEGNISKKGKNWYIQFDSQTYGPILEKDLIKKPESGKITLGIRPERVKFEEERKEKKSKFKSKVEVIESIGSSSYVSFMWAGTLIQTTIPGIIDLKPGDRIMFGFDKEDVLLFDEKGRRIK